MEEYCGFPEVIYDEAELARRAELLLHHDGMGNIITSQVNPMRQVMWRTVEAVLTQPVTEPARQNLTPSFTAGDIARCSGISRSIAAREARTLEDMGFVVKERRFDVPSNLACNYHLKDVEPERQLFRPAPLPGCRHNRAKTFFSYLTPTQQQIIGRLGAGYNEDTPLGPSDVGNNNYTPPFKILEKMGLIVPTSEMKVMYTLTTRGGWLAEEAGLVPQAEPEPSAPYSERVSPKTWAYLKRLIASRYPDRHDTHAQTEERLKKLFDQGIVSVQHSADNGNDVRVVFEPVVDQLTPAKQRVLAYWLRVDRIMYPQPVHGEEARRLSGLQTGGAVGEWVLRQLYLPVAQRAAALNR